MECTVKGKQSWMKGMGRASVEGNIKETTNHEWNEKVAVECRRNEGRIRKEESIYREREEGKI